MSEAGDGYLKQGAHPDPLDLSQPRPTPDAWPPRRGRAFASALMERYREGLRLRADAGARASLLDDLSTYFHMSVDDCVRACVNWEQWSVQEWQAAPRDTAEGIAGFYQATKSWAFNLTWYAYLQAEGYAYPVSVAIAQQLQHAGVTGRGLRHLDFGSGIGTTSQFFRRLGYQTDLADIADTLLAYARYRLERRGEQAGYINLNCQALEPDAYHVITAVDTLVHVPDLAATAAQLHAALRPNGILVANFDVRPQTPENAWHLYADDLDLRWQLQRAGFEPIVSVDRMATLYRRVPSRGLGHSVRGVRDAALLKSRWRPAYRSAKYRVRTMLEHAAAR